MIKNRVLLSALIFSVVWHIFWLSAFTVVVAPKDAKPPKFSSVSFLGPILDQSMLRVSPVAHERSILEKRYLSGVEDLSSIIREKPDQDIYGEVGIGAGAGVFESDEMMTALAVSAIDIDKIDPGNFQ
jgi:hypothetical protein